MGEDERRELLLAFLERLYRTGALAVDPSVLQVAVDETAKG
jgi:hypothetical protein